MAFARLVEPKIHLDIDQDGHGVAISLCRGKSPLSDCLDRLIIQAKAYRCNNLRIAQFPDLAISMQTITVPEIREVLASSE
jgi:hypothetical protein